MCFVFVHYKLSAESMTKTWIGEMCNRPLSNETIRDNLANVSVKNNITSQIKSNPMALYITLFNNKGE